MLLIKLSAVSAVVFSTSLILSLAHRLEKRQIFPFPTGIGYPYSNSILPYGAGTFSQPSYVFSTSSCTPGSVIGTVYATGATGYSITSGSIAQFTVSQSGQITVGSTQLASGTYQINVSTYGSTLASTPVTITATCNGYNFGITGGSTYGATPVFYQPIYSFTLSTCTQGQNLVGNMAAANANSYSILNGNGQFTVDNTGNLYTTGFSAYNPGVITFNVVATGISGLQATTVVSVNVNCLNTLMFG